MIKIMKKYVHRYCDFLFTLLLMVISTILAFGLFRLVPNNSANIALIYILSLILVTRFTDGYGYGVLFSLFSVICVNYFFSYPYFRLNFILTGYPITFLFMLIITTLTSATTSHLKIQAQQLAERDEVLHKAEKEKMRANLLRAISHDLRTPLTSIIGESDAYFELDAKPDEKDELIHRINDDANWLLNMVENLLSVTRIQDTDTTKVNKSSEIVEEIIAEALTRFKKRQPDAHIDVKIPANYIVLPMDPLLIEQVIINLLDNAQVHSGSDQPIQLTVVEETDTVSFHVRDFGKGIEPHMISTIFDGSGTRSIPVSDAHRGMGIGLSICKSIIDAHGGIITAINHVDGAEFAFTLPKNE